MDELTTEMIKAAGPIGTQWLKCKGNVGDLEGEESTEHWKTSILVPLYNKGNKQKCENYWRITLPCHTIKIYEKLLLRKIKHLLEETAGEKQFGFREGRSTVDAIFVMQQVLEKMWEYGKCTLTAFIDLQKAYNKVMRYGSHY